MREPARDCAATGEYNEVGVGCERGGGGQHTRTADAPPTHRPCPEVTTFGPAAPCSPGTQREGKIEHDNGVGPTEAGLEEVVWPKIAIHDPALLPGQASLAPSPLVTGEGFEDLAPELLVELDHLGIDPGPERAREHGLAGATAPENHHPIHMSSVVRRNAINDRQHTEAGGAASERAPDVAERVEHSGAGSRSVGVVPGRLLAASE